MSELVSVILPAYNAGSYVGLAVKSLLMQSHREMELIAIDDGSTDETFSILSRLATGDRRIKLISRENRGLVETLNEGLDLATGAYIARMDADDVCYLNRFSRQVAALRHDQQLSMVATNVDYLYGDGRVIRKPARSASPEECRVESMFHCMFVHPTVMFRADAVRANGWRYDAGFPHCEDFALWSRVVREGRALLLPEVALAWRQGHQSVRSARFRTALFDSMRIVAGNLKTAGVDFELSCLYAFFQRGQPIESNDLRLLRLALGAIRDLRPVSAVARTAFDRGFDAFIGNIVEAGARIGQVEPLLSVLKSGGFDRQITRGQRFRASVRTRLSGDHTARVLQVVQTAHRQWVGRLINDVPELGPDLADELRSLVKV